MSGLAQLAKMGVKGADALVDALRSAKQYVAPQDEALALAQQRAALPVEQGGLGLGPANTAMERAAAMGFDTPSYHATKVDFPSFDANKGVRKDLIFHTDDTDLLQYYGDRVLPLLANKGKTTTVNTEKFMKLINDKNLKSKYDSVFLDDVSEMGSKMSQAVSTNPDMLRSRFAAFDPWRKTAATAAAFGVAAPNLLAEELRKK
jgi:hypothetical protein